jgi:hypothetical protein
VWSASYVLLPLARLHRPIWEYDTKVLGKNLGDHLVYGVSAVGVNLMLGGRHAG